MSLDVNISEPDEFNCVELHSSIENVAKIKNMEDITYHVEYVCGKGENYIANVFRVSIKGSKDETVSVIVKTLINTTRQELFRELHKREVDAYEYVINKFVEIQNDVSDKIVLPKHILASSIKGNEVIILEDLLLDGFEIESKLVKCEQIDFDSARLIMKKLAKFHALTFVLENKNEYLGTKDKIRNMFDDILYKDSFLSKTKLQDHYSDSFEISLNLIDNADARKKLKHVKSKLLEILKFYTKPRKYNVFCHGDLWINNILFKNQDHTKEVCFLDFQAMRYASPVTDILYFMYLCTDSEFRHHYFEQLKKEYYDSFTACLKEYNVDNTVYPEEAFYDDIEQMRPYGLVIALKELRIITTKPEDEFLLKSTLKINANLDLEPLELYRKRVNDVVAECVHSGVLDKLLIVVRDLYNENKA